LPPSPSVLPRYPMRHQGVAAEGLGDLSGQTYTFTVNSLGLRGPEMDFHNAAVRILCAGGGTTECMYVPDEQSWPWALQDRLAERLGRSVFVGNAGARGFATVNVDYLLRAYADDRIPEFVWVVVLCGIDDWENEATPGDPERLEGVRAVPLSQTLLFP